jgi:hypothetical protein
LAGPKQHAYVVRDKSIDAGGSTYVSDLVALRKRLMSGKSSGDWTLVLSIHGSEDRVAAQKGPNWQKNAIFYESADVRTIFGTPDFVAWRRAHGPTRVVLVSCQLSASFEHVVQSVLLKSGKAPSKISLGLGKGCKPDASTETYRWIRTTGRSDIEVPVRSWTTYRKMSAADKEIMLTSLKQWNSDWGYFGSPPVPEADVLHWYFDESPYGGWPCVRVEVGGQPTEIPYWNRTSGAKAAEFRRLCSQSMGRLRPHRPRVPPAP